jgi:Dna[CI] antecedent, DciA
MKRIGDDVRRELSRFGPALGMTEIVAAWPEAVGPAITRNAWPARLSRDGTLHVTTSSSAWAFELTQLEATIRAKLGERMEVATPRALRFTPGPLPELGAKDVTTSQRTVPAPSPAARAAGERIAAPIADEALREAVARAAAASLAAATRRASDRPVW